METDIQGTDRQVPRNRDKDTHRKPEIDTDRMEAVKKTGTYTSHTYTHTNILIE